MIERWLNEEHHGWYGRPWALGYHAADFLRKHCINSQDSVIDIGCGAGRIAQWVVPKVARYVGVEPHDLSREAFEYEMGLIGYDGDVAVYPSIPEAVTHQDELFDVALLFSVLQHLDNTKWVEAIRGTHSALKTGGFAIIAPGPLRGLHDTELLLGFEHIHTETQQHPFLTGTRWQDWTEWTMWRKR